LSRTRTFSLGRCHMSGYGVYRALARFEQGWGNRADI
jgi:hypothetical protein